IHHYHTVLTVLLVTIYTTHHHFIHFFFNAPSTTEIYTLSLHDALPISSKSWRRARATPTSTRRSTTRSASSPKRTSGARPSSSRSEEHTSELQSQSNLVCRLLLEKKKKNRIKKTQLTRLLRY